LLVHRHKKEKKNEEYVDYQKKPLTENDPVLPFGDDPPEDNLTLICIFGFLFFLFFKKKKFN
jgi:hypothetical protein